MTAHSDLPSLLLVDDHEQSCVIGKRYLEKNGYRVTTATSGQTALSILSDNHFDLIILDLIMPDMDGFEVCRVIRSTDETKKTPILIMSGMEDVTAIQNAFDAGATDVTTKPVNWTLLTFRIQFILRSATLAAKVDQLAYYDPLTNLPNRHYLANVIDEKMEFARRYDINMALLSIDLDNFIRINDTLGHAVGDIFLTNIAKRFQTTLRNADVFMAKHHGTLTLARLGGDKFAILLPCIQSESEAAVMCKKLLEDLAEPFPYENHEFILTASIGVSLCSDADSHDGMIKYAEMAMYNAKSLGKNQYAFFHERMQNDAKAALTIESHLRKAIEQQELSGFLQPQLDFATHRITGFEFLLRWHCPAMGNVPPNKFIPIAEKCGLIKNIGYWVIEKACDYLGELKKRHLDATIAINVSPMQLHDVNFVDFICDQIATHGIQARQLELEITESVMMENTDTSITLLTQLHERGFNIAIDDFGTGYSSLSYLKKLPLSKLKIDKSFIDDVPTCHDDVAMVKAMVAMSHNLHLKVIAEGVETAEQLNFLKNLGCDAIQGYYIGKPMPFDEALALLTKAPGLPLFADL